MKKSSSKSATIVASYSTDLGLVINWLRLNKLVSSIGPIEEISTGAYAVRVKSKVSKKDLNIFVKDRFGVFAKVK